MKRFFAILTALLLLAGLLCGLPVTAEGSLTASASSTSVTVGQSVSVTLTYSGGGTKIGGLIGYFDYDATVFSYTSFTGTDGMDANGDAGKVKFVYSAPGSTAPNEVSITLTLKATAAGNGKFSVSTDEFFNDEDYSSLGTPGKTLSVSATNPTLSGNANLASLKPSKGTLTPKFSAKTTEYTISVDYSVTSLTLSATTEHTDAKTSISGENSLKVGKNTRTITVTAPNGTTKKYTVVITREAQKATTTTDKSQNGTTTTTSTTPQPDALEVTVDGVLMTVVDTQPKLELPKSFSWDYINLNGVDVFAAKSEKLGLTLLCLKNEVQKTEDFYIYYAASGEFESFRPLTVSAGDYILLDMPAGQTAPNGTVASTFPYEGGSVGAFAYEDTGLADYQIVYAKSPAGITGLYVYDRTDGSFQRYYQQPGTQKVEVDNTPEPPDDEPKKPGAFAAFITKHKSTILTVAAACCGLALLIAAVVFAIRLIPGSKKGKH